MKDSARYAKIVERSDEGGCHGPDEKEKGSPRRRGARRENAKPDVGCGEPGIAWANRICRGHTALARNFPDDRIPSCLVTRGHMVFHGEPCRAARQSIIGGAA